MGTGGSGVGSKVWGGCIGIIEGYPGGECVWDGLKIGLGVYVCREVIGAPKILGASFSSDEILLHHR